MKHKIDTETHHFVFFFLLKWKGAHLEKLNFCLSNHALYQKTIFNFCYEKAAKVCFTLGRVEILSVFNGKTFGGKVFTHFSEFLCIFLREIQNPQNHSLIQTIPKFPNSEKKLHN